MPKSEQERAEIRRQTEERRQQGKDLEAHRNSRGVKLGGSLGHLSKGEINDDDFDLALQQLGKADDRACAVIGGAFLEDGVTQLVRCSFPKPWQEGAEELFEVPGAPCGTFRNKIIVAYALGGITDKERADMDRVRDIRNVFSHALRPLSFSQSNIAASCRQLDWYPWDESFPQEPPASKPRIRFELACRGLWIKCMKLANSRASEAVRRAETQNALNALIATGLKGIDAHGGGDSDPI